MGTGDRTSPVQAPYVISSTPGCACSLLFARFALKCSPPTSFAAQAFAATQKRASDAATASVRQARQLTRQATSSALGAGAAVGAQTKSLVRQGTTRLSKTLEMTEERGAQTIQARGTAIEGLLLHLPR